MPLPTAAALFALWQRHSLGPAAACRAAHPSQAVHLPWAEGWRARQSAAGSTRRWRAGHRPATPLTGVSRGLTPAGRGVADVCACTRAHLLLCSAVQQAPHSARGRHRIRGSPAVADSPAPHVPHPVCCPCPSTPACHPAAPSPAGWGRPRSTQCDAAHLSPAYPGTSASSLLQGRAEWGCGYESRLVGNGWVFFSPGRVGHPGACHRIVRQTGIKPASHWSGLEGNQVGSDLQAAAAAAAAAVQCSDAQRAARTCVEGSVGHHLAARVLRQRVGKVGQEYALLGALLATVHGPAGGRRVQAPQPWQPPLLTLRNATWYRTTVSRSSCRARCTT